MDALERLIAIEDIKSLMARRVRSLDECDWDTYRACHAPDHISYGIPGAPSAGRDVMMINLRKSLDGVRTIHNVHSPRIEFLSATEAKASWALEDWAFWKQGGDEHWLHGWGYYDDTYAKLDDTWLFTSRRLSRLRVEHSPGSRRAPRPTA